MPKPSKVTTRNNFRWLSVLKSCLIISAVVTFSACSLTSSSSSTASLISNGSVAPAPKAQAASSPQVSQTVSVSNAAAAPSVEVSSQPGDMNINLAEAFVADPGTAGAAVTEVAADTTTAHDETAAVAITAPEAGAEMVQTAEVETVSDDVMESALATIQKAEARLDLIDKNLCTTGLNGNLITGQAGQGLLRDNGIKSAYTLTGDIMPPPPSFDVAAAIPDPAPSAGTSEAAVSLTSLNTSKTTTSSAKTSSKSGITESLLMAAYQQTGRHYKSGGQNPDTGFDASGFTRWVYAQRGLSLPKDALRQANGGRQVSKDELRPGDLMVYRDPNGDANSYHVGIYTGQGNFLHAASKTGVVTETAAFGPQYSPYFVGGRRYYEDLQASPLSDVQKMSATSSAVKLALSELGPDDTLKRPVAKKKPVKTAAKTSSKKSKPKNKGS